MVMFFYLPWDNSALQEDTMAIFMPMGATFKDCA